MLLALIFSLAALAIENPATAQPRQTDFVEFNVPAQAVPAALSDFARQSRVQFLLITEGYGTVQANALVGSYTVQQALDVLLEGTGLTASYSPDSGVTVRRASEPAASAQAEREPPATESKPAAQDAGSGDDLYIEEVLVTGSRIRGAQNASPIVVISSEDIQRAGFATVEQVIDKLPQHFGGGASLDTLTDTGNDTNVVGGNVGNEAGGTSVNLRGLGASSTLVLLNGHRMSPSGFGSAFTNVSSIPITAIERVEVLTDGASAIYGSDAIGGVVNFILREEYDGAETRLRYGTDGRGDTSDILFGQLFGNTWEDGSVLLTYEYYDRDELANSAREFTSTSDLRQFGGTDRRVHGGSPANIDAGGRLWAIPAGQDGTALTAGDFPAAADGLPLVPPNQFNNRSLGDVLPGVKRHSAVLRFFKTTGSIELFADARYSTQKTVWRRNFSPIDIEVTNANPFFVDPTGTGLTAVTVRQYALDNELGPQISTGEIDSLGAAVGVRFDIGGNWQGELISNWAKEEQERRTNLSLDMRALDAAVNPADPNVDPARVFNPFGDDPLANAAIIESLINRSPARSSAADNAIRSLSLNLDGKLFELPGGAARLVAGTEIRGESLQTARLFEGSDEVSSDFDRAVTSVYAEVFLPLAGRGNGLPGLERLELSLATRYEHYNDVGDSVNPKMGLVWSPVPSLIVRGTYGASFKAPALLDLDVTRRSANLTVYFPQPFVDDGTVPFPMIGRSGGNKDLQPEKATTWTAGIQWQPLGLEGLLLDITYFNVDFEDRIALPLTSFANAGDPRFASLVNRSPTAGEIAALVNDPGWLNPSGASEADLLSGAVPVAVVDGRLNNLARSVVTGLELQMHYRFETAAGLIELGLNGDYMFDFERALLDRDPLLDEVDTYGRPIDLRARASVTWQRKAWSVSAFLNYTDNYTDRISEPALSVDSWTTVDLNVGYDIGNAGGILANTHLSLTVQNLFDEDPPFVNTPAGLAYDSYNADPEGRLLAFEVARKW